MTAKREDQPRTAPPERDQDAGRPEADSGKGRKDVTGIMPDNIRVDPDITEGHPGYRESGDSEIIPPHPSTEKKT